MPKLVTYLTEVSGSVMYDISLYFTFLRDSLVKGRFLKSQTKFELNRIRLEWEGRGTTDYDQCEAFRKASKN